MRVGLVVVVEVVEEEVVVVAVEVEARRQKQPLPAPAVVAVLTAVEAAAGASAEPASVVVVVVEAEVSSAAAVEPAGPQSRQPLPLVPRTLPFDPVPEPAPVEVVVAVAAEAASAACPTFVWSRAVPLIPVAAIEASLVVLLVVGPSVTRFWPVVVRQVVGKRGQRRVVLAVVRFQVGPWAGTPVRPFLAVLVLPFAAFHWHQRDSSGILVSMAMLKKNPGSTCPLVKSRSGSWPIARGDGGP